MRYSAGRRAQCLPIRYFVCFRLGFYVFFRLFLFRQCRASVNRVFLASIFWARVAKRDPEFSSGWLPFSYFGRRSFITVSYGLFLFSFRPHCLPSGREYVDEFYASVKRGASWLFNSVQSFFSARMCIQGSWGEKSFRCDISASEVKNLVFFQDDCHNV